MKRIISKVLLSLFFFVMIINICFAQNTARGIAAEKIAVEQNDEVKESEPRLCFSTGHYGAVRDVIYSPDGRYVASIASDNSIIIWETKTGKEIKKLIGHNNFVRSIAFSPDGRYIASASWDKTVRIWNIDQENDVKIFRGHKKFVNCVIYSSDGNYIASASDDYSIIVWSVKYGAKVKTLTNTSSVEKIVFSPNNQYIASCDGEKNGIIRIWDIQESMILYSFEEHYVRSIDFSPDGRYIASANGETIKIWNLVNRKLENEINCSYVDCVKYSPYGNEIVGGCGKSIRVWNSKFYNEIFRLFDSKNTESICSLAFRYDGKYLVTGYSDGGIAIWNMESHKIIRKMRRKTADDVVFSFSKDGTKIACGGFDAPIKIWDIYNGEISKILDSDSEFISSLCFSPNGNYIAAGMKEDDTIKIWNIKTGKFVRKLIGRNTDAIESIAFSPNGNFLASCGWDKIVRLWNVEEGKEVINFVGHTGWVDSVVFSSDGKYIASSSEDDESVRVWDIYSGKMIRKIDMLFGPNKGSISFSVDKKSIVTTAGGIFSIWNLKNGKELKTYYTHERFLCYSCLFDKIFLYKDDKIIIRDINKFNITKELKFSNTNLLSLMSISPDGKYIVSGSEDGTIKVWDAETGSLIYTIVNGKNGDYLTYTPEGFFTGTEWAMKNLVHIVDGMDVIGIDQVYDKLYRPDLVAAKMRGEDISEYAKEVNLASIVCSGNAPAVAIENLPELSDIRDVTFDICVQNTGGGIGNVSIVLNGKTIRLSEGVESSNGEQKIFRHTVTLQNGQNKIEAFAMNSAGMIESRRASADVNWQGKTSKPNLYVLTVAVNKYRDKDLWLNYCVPDAASIEESFKKQQSGLYQNVCVYSLKDAEVTKEGLEQKFKELSSIVTADDVFVFFVSGHGTTYDDGDYYFIPVNFRYTNKTDIPLNAISKSDLTKNLSLIKAGKTLMMLDTCNSGSFFADSNKRGMGDKGIFERLSKATGHAILAAASDSQSAMEGYNGHGVFTYVLLDGLAGNADSDGDGFVTLTELSSYVENQVPELSYEKWGYEQVPQKELRRQDFPIAEKLSE